MATYIYSISNDTLNGLIHAPSLVDEILDAGIALNTFDTDFSHINTIEDTLEIIFNITLSAGEESDLTTVVNNHDGISPNADESVTEFEKVDAIGFKKFTYSGDTITKIELFLDEGMSTLIYTKNLNYTGDKVTSIDLTRESDLSIFIKTIIYSGDTVTNIVYS